MARRSPAAGISSRPGTGRRLGYGSSIPPNSIFGLAPASAPPPRNSAVMQRGGPMKPLALVVGGGELPLLRKETADFAGHRARYGLPVTYEEIPGADHFSIMKEMAAPSGRITTLIRQLFERTAG